MDAKETFHNIAAETRANMIELKDNPEVFIKHSIITLRPAVYRVRRFAKDKRRLDFCWKTYEEQNPEYFTASFMKAEKNLGGVEKDHIKIFDKLIRELEDSVS